MIDQMGGRKIAALIVMMLLGVGAVVLKGDVPVNFLSLMEWVFGGFIIGNGIEHAAGAVSGARSVANTELDPALAQLLDATRSTQEGVSTVQQTLLSIVKAYNIKA